jgi:hypothetical protein
MKAMREHAVGVRWETSLAEIYYTSTLFYLGETREMARLVPLFLRDALERGDVYAQHGMRGWRANIAWLILGRPDEARAHAEAVAAERNTAEGFHLQHYYEVLTQAHIDLYEGATAAAWRRVDDAWKPLSSSYLLRIQSVRVEATFLRARTALAMVGELPAAPLLRIARKAARQLGREGAPWASSIAMHLRGLIAQATGDRAAAADLLERAERAYATSDMALFASVVRLRRGELDGGPGGAAWSAEARQSMTAQAIVDVDAIARVLSPLPAPRLLR